MKTLIGIALMVLFVQQSFIATAQCCGAGNPVGGFADVASVPYKTLLVGANYRYSYSNRYFTGTERADFTPDKMNYNYSGIDFSYGLSTRLSINGAIGYFINKSKTYNIEGFKPMKASGLGDCDVELKYSVIKQVLKRFELIVGAGIRMPVGVFDQEVDGVKLPISLQPSSGSFKYNFNLYMYKGFHDFSFYSRFMTELATKIESKNFDYKYGNLYLFSVLANYSIHQKFNGALQARFEHRSRAKRENNIIVEASGGTVLLCSPQFTFMPIPSLGISILADIPVYINLNGTQSANSLALAIKVTKSLNFNPNK